VFSIKKKKIGYSSHLRALKKKKNYVRDLIERHKSKNTAQFIKYKYFILRQIVFFS